MLISVTSPKLSKKQERSFDVVDQEPISPIVLNDSLISPLTNEKLILPDIRQSKFNAKKNIINLLEIIPEENVITPKAKVFENNFLDQNDLKSPVKPKQNPKLMRTKTLVNEEVFQTTQIRLNARQLQARARSSEGRRTRPRSKTKSNCRKK